MRKRILRWALVAILLLLTAQAIWDNQNLGRTDYHVTDELLPEAFDGYRIVQISDLHNASFGKDNSRLIEMVRSAQPDIIAITGDMIDSRRTNVDVALQFAREAVKIAPCYYVTGNHELRDEELDTLLDGLETAGVTVLRGESVRLEKDGQRIQLVGIDDPSLVTQNPECYGAVVSQMLDRYQSSHYTVLLTHRPEFMGGFLPVWHQPGAGGPQSWWAGAASLAGWLVCLRGTFPQIRWRPLSAGRYFSGGIPGPWQQLISSADQQSARGSDGYAAYGKGAIL